MNFQINWSNPLIAEEEVLQLQPSDLDAFYVTASDLDKGNVFFVLLRSFQYYNERYNWEAAAHLCYLMAYYLFVTYTPPGSYELAMHFIAEAVQLHPLDTYKEWQTLIEKGN